MKLYYRFFWILMISIPTMIQSSLGQTYLTTGGVRIGNGLGLTVNQRVMKKVTVEGILQNDFRNTTYLHVLGRRHHSILSRRANIYVGGGAHFGVQNGAGGVAGLDAILGTEMTLGGFNVSADFKPHLTSGEGNGLKLNGAISVRYVFVKDNAIKKWKRKRDKKKKKKNQESFFDRFKKS